MVGHGVVAHRLGQTPLLLQPMISLLLEFTNCVGGKELAAPPMLGRLPGDCLGAFFAEVERTGVARIWPCAAGAVKPIRLVHRQQRSRSSDLDALLAQRSGSGVQRPPTASRSVIG